MKKSNRFLSRLTAASVALASFLLAGAAPRAAHAWKPKTHIYLAEQALKDALDNGKVTIYETEYKTGKITGTLGEFDVDPRILNALRQAPQQYRAGVMGPDAYPDILTGQQIIHPDEATSLNNLAGGTNSWLTYIWSRAFDGNQSPQVQAFAVGYLTHAAGDVFAHTFVNHFSGGEFQMIPDPTNAIKHLILEGYIGKRTPQTLSATPGTTKVGIITVPTPVGSPLNQENTSIDGVESFIYNEMTYAAPGSVLEQKLMKGGGTKFSIPYLFSTLRNGLQKDVEEYDRIRLSKTGPARLTYAAQYGPKAEYKRAWIADIDFGLKAWPKTSHEIAKSLVYNEGGSDLPRAKAAMALYVREHLASMAGVPDLVVASAAYIADVINSILPQELRDMLKDLQRIPLEVISKSVTGKTPEEWADYLKNPDVHFDFVMNRPGGGHDGDTEHPVTLAAFNRDYLKISDAGYLNPSLKWEINQLPPAFNTLQMCKLMLLGENGMKQLAAALHAKNADMAPLPSPFQNVMLGWVRSLDRGNQWQGFPAQHGGVSPRPVFAENNGAAYQKMFLPQTGEKSWLVHDATPVGGTQPPSGPEYGQGGTIPAGPQPVVQDLSVWAGDWETTFGPVKLTLVAPDKLTGTVMHRYDNSLREGEKLEITYGNAVGRVKGTWRTEGGYADNGTLEWLLGASGQAFTGTIFYSKNSDQYRWDGTRVGPAPAPAPTPTNPGSTNNGNTGIVPPPLVTTPVTSLPSAPSTGSYTGSGEYKGLTEYDVRLDSVKLGRSGNIEAIVSLKNVGKRSSRVNHASLDMWMFDTDGAGWGAIQNVYRASGDVPEPVGNLEVASGDEVRVRYVFRKPAGLRGLNKLRIQDRYQYEKSPINFDLNNLVLSGADNTGGALPSGLTSYAYSAFKDLDDWDMRLDAVKKRQNKVELYFTVKNTTAKPLRFSAVRMRIADMDGVTGSDASTLYRATGSVREPFTESLDVEPGGEMRVCFIVTLPSANVAPKRLTVEVNGGGKQTWDMTSVR